MSSPAENPSTGFLFSSLSWRWRRRVFELDEAMVVVVRYRCRYNFGLDGGKKAGKVSRQSKEAKRRDECPDKVIRLSHSHVAVTG